MVDFTVLNLSLLSLSLRVPMWALSFFYHFSCNPCIDPSGPAVGPIKLWNQLIILNSPISKCKVYALRPVLLYLLMTNSNTQGLLVCRLPTLKFYGSHYPFFKFYHVYLFHTNLNDLHYSCKGIQSLPQTHIFQCLYLCKLICKPFI